MPICVRHIASFVAVTLTCCLLGGCGTVNEKLSGGMADVIPAWAGGLPADAPPRPGSPEYDQFMKERERQRQLPAAEQAKPAAPAPTANR